MKTHALLFLVVALFACRPTHRSSSIANVLNAHGGFEKWNTMKQFNYDMANGEHHLIELQERKVRIDAEAHTIGFDGKDVWFTPEDAQVKNARFYHNLYFYFIAMPFVVGDPGVKYEDIEDKELLGKTYKGIKISYNDGVGDSPKDNYIIYYDPATSQMEWLMYTVTFGKEARDENYRLIRYEDWNDVNGLFLANKLSWYTYGDSVVGDVRNVAEFSNLSLSTEVPADTSFVMPEGASIGSMPSGTAH